MGEDWATDSERPQAMIMDLEEFKLNMDHYIALMATYIDSHVPRSYGEARKCMDLWKESMEEEMEIMRKQGIFKLVPWLKDQHIVGLKWIYTNKYDADGEIT